MLRAEGESQKGDPVKALMRTASEDFTGTSLRKALPRGTITGI
jgi:hypothetical protein